MCKAAGLKQKTSHCLCVICASSLCNAGVEEELIRERTGHCSDSDAQDVVSAGPLNSCSFANCSVKIKVQYLQ